MQIRVSWPALSPKFSRCRNGPKTPRQFSGLSTVCGHEAANSIVTSRSAHDYFVLNHQRGAGRAVVLVPIRIRDIPNQVARAGIQAKQMGIVRVHVDVRMPICFAWMPAL